MIKHKLGFLTFTMSAAICLVVSITLWILILYNITNIKYHSVSIVQLIHLVIKANIVYASAFALITIIGLRSAIHMDDLSEDNKTNT